MQIGDIVKHKKLGLVGKIVDTFDVWGWEDEYTSTLCIVSFFNLKKKHRKHYYNINELVPHQLEESTTDDSLSDWLSTPNQKLRSALAKKKEKNRLANLRKPEQRLDWRGKGR